MHPNIVLLWHDMACPRVGGYDKLHRWNETRGQLYAQSRKDVFERYLSVKSNLANLNLLAAVMQQKAFTWVDFISPRGIYSLYIYNKVYTPAMGVLSLRIYRCRNTFSLMLTSRLTLSSSLSSLREPPWSECIYHSTWAGFTLLILR